MKLRIEIKDHVPPINSRFDEVSDNYRVPFVKGQEMPPLTLEVELEDSHLAMQQADAFLRACLGQRLDVEEKMDALKEEAKQSLKMAADSALAKGKAEDTVRSLQRHLDRSGRTLKKLIKFCDDHDFPRDSVAELALIVKDD